MAAVGLPPPQNGPSVWDRESVSKLKPGTATPEWVEQLTEEEVQLLGHAADRVLLASEDGGAKGDLNLEAVEQESAGLRGSSIGLHALEGFASVMRGRGFVLFKKLPVQAWGDAKSAAAFVVFSRLLGPLRMQNAAGHLLGHVRDLNLSSSDPNVRVYQTSERQTFHTDTVDAVGLLCLRQAPEGGHSAIVSAGAIYNELWRRRPDLLKLLLEPTAFDRRSEVPKGARPYYYIPIFSWYEGELSVFYQRQYIDSSQRFAEAPRHTAEFVEALDLFDEVANDERLHASMHLEPGDLQFVHNHALLHDRTAFRDHPDPSLKRHLLRSWVAADDARPLAPIMADIYGTVEVGNRGGISAAGAVRNVTWRPPPEAPPAAR